MKIENFDTVKNLIDRLNHVQCKLDTLVDERERCLKDKVGEETVSLFQREPFTVPVKAYNEVLMIMITHYQDQRDGLTAQISLL